MLQKLPLNNFEWIEDTSQFNEDFIKSYHEESDEGHFLEVDVQYYMNFIMIYHERMKIEKAEKLVTNLQDQTEHVIHIRNLKQTLNHGLVLKKFHRVIQFNQNTWLKPYIDINTKLRKKVKSNFEKDFSKIRIMQLLENLWKM